MRQGLRFLFKPQAFFNQLQWSSHHWIILLGFFTVAAIETQLGRQQPLYLWTASILGQKWGIGFDVSLWVITVAKLAVMLLGAWIISFVVWLLGAFFGRNSSRRVLSRRLAVVFTVLLTGYTAQHLAPTSPFFMGLGLFLFVWGSLLGYFAIREQFNLNFSEAAVLGLFTLFLSASTWHFSNHAWQAVLKSHNEGVAQKAVPSHRIR